MGENSKIQWTDHTFNPWRGCTKVSDGCKNCYAEQLSKRNPAVLGEWGPGAKRVRAAESYWQLPLKWDREAFAAGERRRVFCASLADVFDEEVPDKWRDELFSTIDDTQNLDWLILTKRPANAARYMEGYRRWLEQFATRVRATQASEFDAPIAGAEWPLPNVWIGVSVENQKTADARIPILLQIPAVVRFLSCEPLLGPIEFSDVTRRSDAVFQLGKPALTGIDWVIAGGESGPGARPMHPDWARSLRDQCVAAGVPFFFKQRGEWTWPDEDLEEDDAVNELLASMPTDWRDSAGKYRYLERNGTFGSGYDGRGGEFVIRVGKKAAGRLLDRREWNEFPEARA